MFKGIYHGRRYHGEDLRSVLQRAWKAGVDRIIVTGGSLEESREALAIADTDARLYCTVGVHPTRCLEFEESGNADRHLEQLLALAREGLANGKVVAIGECGLDYDRLQFCKADIQQRYFEAQFTLAEVLQLPMFLHMRAAAYDFFDIVEQNKEKWVEYWSVVSNLCQIDTEVNFLLHSDRISYVGSGRFVAGVIHSFTGTAEDRDHILAIKKLNIGINGCSLKTAENLQVMSGIPVERMMIETDAPYCEIKSSHAGFMHVQTCWPSKRKEKHDKKSTVKSRNEPCHVRQVLEVLAGQRGVDDVSGFARTLYENTCRVFFPRDLDTSAGVVPGRQCCHGVF